MASESSATLTDYSRKLEGSNKLNTGANSTDFMRTINARFVSMAKAINGLQVQNKGFEQFMEEFNQVKAELIQVKDKLAEVTAERDALKRKYLGSAASIHANNTVNMGNKDKDQSNMDQEHDQQQEFPTLNTAQQTMAQRVQQRRKRVTQGQRKAAARLFMEPSGESTFHAVAVCPFLTNAVKLKYKYLIEESQRKFTWDGCYLLGLFPEHNDSVQLQNAHHNILKHL